MRMTISLRIPAKRAHRLAGMRVHEVIDAMRLSPGRPGANLQLPVTQAWRPAEAACPANRVTAVVVS
jgi:hypothetical protein